MNSLRLGAAKVDITPQTPVPLAGFGHRTGVLQGVAHPLYARVFLLEQGRVRILLITADLIWWGPELVERIQQSVWARWGIPQDHVLLHATHTHSGPQTTGRFTKPLGAVDAGYLNWLEAQVYQGIEAAVADISDVTVQMAQGQWREGIHRRKWVDGRCIMAPNPDGPVDPDVTVIRFGRSGGAKGTPPKAVWVHATCHPTVTDDNLVSSEFPGVAMAQVESFCGADAIVGYLQGFCGDVRPSMIRGDAFYRGHDTDVERIGQSLAAEVIRVLHSKTLLDVAPARLASETFEVRLRTQTAPDDGALKRMQGTPGILSEWAERMLSNPELAIQPIQLAMTHVTLADGFSLLTANAEMVVEYGLRLKQLFPGKILPMGYTNGMIGYVPTAQQVAEGGYESVESTYYFLLPAPFTAAVEKDIDDQWQRWQERVTSR